LDPESGRLGPLKLVDFPVRGIALTEDGWFTTDGPRSSYGEGSRSVAGVDEHADTATSALMRVEGGLPTQKLLHPPSLLCSGSAATDRPDIPVGNRRSS
jgi:hypothetical protein